MNNIRFSILALVALFLAVSCGDKKPDPVLQEAFGIHEQAIASQGEVESMLTEADNLIATLTTRFQEAESAGDAEMGMKISSAVTQLQSFRPNLEKWADALVEVPGIAHEHNHDHGHEHKEVPEHIKNMAPADILALQKEFLVKIEGLKGSLQMALGDANSILQ